MKLCSKAIGLALLLALLPTDAAHLGASINHEALFTLEVSIAAASSVATADQVANLQRRSLWRDDDVETDPGFEVRSRVRAAVREWPVGDRLELLEFFAVSEAFDSTFNKLLIESAAAPPDFAVHGAATPAMQQLSHVLRRAFQNLPIQALWQQEQGSWFDAQLAPDLLRRIHDDLDAYLRFNDGSTSSTVVVVNPLMAAFNGVCAAPASGGYVQVCGPTPDATSASVLVAHELLHMRLRNVLSASDVVGAINRSECFYQALQARGTDFHGYTEWRYYMEEGLVRVLSYRALGLQPHFSDIASEEIFSTALSEYEAGDTALHRAVTRALDDVANKCSAGFTVAPGR